MFIFIAGDKLIIPNTLAIFSFVYFYILVLFQAVNVQKIFCHTILSNFLIKKNANESIC
jgi:hypothetical protein